jgi:hypothetical protein
MSLVTLPPLLLPGLLLLAGIGSLVVARQRRGRAGTRLEHTVAVAYLLLGVVAVVESSWLGWDRGTRFWGAAWNESAGVLRLDRPFPLPDLEVSSDQVHEVAELIFPSHQVFGVRRAAEYELRMKSGATLCSGPIFEEQSRRKMLRQLEPVAHGRLIQFRVGRQGLAGS